MRRDNPIRFIKLFFSSILILFASLCVLSCNMDAEPLKFLKEYGDIASVKRVSFEYGGRVTEYGGWFNIDASASDDLVVKYEIDNPGDFELIGSLSVAGESDPEAAGIKLDIDSNTSMTVTYPASYLAAHDMDNGGSGDISPGIFLTRARDNYGQSFDSRAIRSNAPPPNFYNVLSQSWTDSSAGADDRMVVCFAIPDLPNDVCLLKLEDQRTRKTHSFEIVNGVITLGPEANGWSITSDIPGTLEPTGENAPTFHPEYYSGHCYYIISDVQNLQGRDIFYMTLSLIDKAGLPTTSYVASRLRLLDPPIWNGDTIPTENTYENPYFELTVSPSDTVPGITLRFVITDEDGNVVAGTNGETETSAGTVKFHLYPKTDGSENDYYVEVFCVKEGWSSVGYIRTLHVVGKTLEVPVADPSPASGTTVPQDTEVTFTSPQNGTIVWTKSGGGSVDKEQSPVKIVLEDPGTNAFDVFAEKDYYKPSPTTSFAYEVVVTKVYVKKGAPAGGTGTKDNPFDNIQSAMAALDANGATDKSYNTIYVMGDFADMASSINVSNSGAYYNIVGCDADGNAVAPVQLGVSAPGSVIELSAGTIALRAVKITNATGAANGAVNVSGGTFIVKDQVTIFGNTDSSSNPANVRLAAGQTITINQENLGGTKVGVATATAPTGGKPVTITSGYADSGVTDDPADHFTSDLSGVAVLYNLAGTEAVLSVNGGTIDIGDIYNVTFAKTASEGVYTFTATASTSSGSEDITASVDEWSLKLYYLNTDTGMSSTTNQMDLNSLAAGTYIMKITALYGGKTYSGEVEIDIN